MPAAEPSLIPLVAKDGSVRAWAKVDAEDAAFLSQWTWRYHGGYAVRGQAVDGVRVNVYVHRVLLGLAVGDGLQGDHINRDRLDCRRSNLRVVTHAQNGQNLASFGGTSEHRGVFWHKAARKWAANVRFGGRNNYLGLFTDELEAARAAADFRREHMPFSEADQIAA